MNKVKQWSVGLLAAVALCLGGGGVFAQGLDFSGTTLTTGLWAHFTDMTDKGPYLQAMGDEGVPMLLEFKSRYVTPDENAGIRAIFNATLDTITVAANQSTTYARTLNLESAYGWIKAFNGILTLTGGYWDPEKFETPGPLESDCGMRGVGLILEAAPIEGLTLAASGFAKQGDTTLLSEAKYIFTAEYIMADTFRVLANFATHQYGNLEFTNDKLSTYIEQQAKDMRFNIAVNFLGLANIGLNKLAVEAEIRDLGGGRTADLDEYYLPIGATTYPLYLGQAIGWGNDAITVNLKCKELIRIGDDREEYAPAIHFGLTGSYKINQYIVPKVGFDLIMNSLAWNNSAVDLRFDEKVNWEDCVKDTGGFGLRPAVEFRLNGLTRNTVEVGYSIKVDISKDAKPTSIYSTMDQAIYAMLKVSL